MKPSPATSALLLLVHALVMGCAVAPTDADNGSPARNTSDPSKEAYSPLVAEEIFPKEEFAEPSTAGSEPVSSTSSALVTGTYDVGVIANGACPNPVQIYMDDEDVSNNSSRTGWVGSISSATRLNFCRVDGSAFRSTGWCNSGEYAVLKLGTSCPPGSKELSRYFDNEDILNRNSNSGNIAPSTQNSSGTNLKFCAFTRYPLLKCPTSSPNIEFPNVGFSYGVFANTNVYRALQTGTVYTDDEDSANGNSWNLSLLEPFEVTAVQTFLSGSTNTTLKTARVR